MPNPSLWISTDSMSLEIILPKKMLLEDLEVILTYQNKSFLKL